MENKSIQIGIIGIILFILASSSLVSAVSFPEEEAIGKAITVYRHVEGLGNVEITIRSISKFQVLFNTFTAYFQKTSAYVGEQVDIKDTHTFGAGACSNLNTWEFRVDKWNTATGSVTQSWDLGDFADVANLISTSNCYYEIYIGWATTDIGSYSASGSVNGGSYLGGNMLTVIPSSGVDCEWQSWEQYSSISNGHIDWRQYKDLDLYDSNPCDEYNNEYKTYCNSGYHVSGTTSSTVANGIKSCVANSGGDSDGGDGSEKGDIRIIDLGGTTESYMNDEATIEVTLKNFGNKQETINLEGGFYSSDYAHDPAGLFATYNTFSVVPQPNCNPYERFVQTKKITLAGGASEKVELKVIPYHALSTYDPGVYSLSTDPLILFVGLYKECLGGYINEAGTTGIWSGGNTGMFYYEEYTISCTFKFLGIGGADIWCGKEKIGTCSGSKVTINKKCNIPLTVDVVNGTVTPVIGSDEDARQKALTKSQIKDATTTTLLASVCTLPDQCESNSSCMSLNALKEENILTDIEAREVANSISKQITDTVGVATGISATVGCAALIGLPTGPASIPICGAVGLATGLGLVGFFDSLVEADLEKTGICVKEESSISKYFEWAAWFDIDGNGKKDGTDGMIIAIGLGILLIYILKQK